MAITICEKFPEEGAVVMAANKCQEVAVLCNVV